MTQATPMEIGANEAERNRNRMTGAGVVNDPYPVFDELRASGPVHTGGISERFELQGPELSWPGIEQFSCYDWETCDAVLRDHETYSSRWYVPTLEHTVGKSIIQMDEPEHRRYRGLVQPAFTRAQIDGWRERWVQPAVDRLVDGFLAAGAGRVDLYTELCAHVPVYTIASSFGVAGEDVSHFHQLAVAAVGNFGDPAESMRAAQEIGEYLRGVIAERRKNPAEDLISVLCEVEVDDPDTGQRERLTDDEILAFARIMLPAGAGTTYRGLGATIFGLLDTGQYEAVRDDRGLLEGTLEESLRWELPLTSISRLVTRDTELGGVEIPAGSAMHCCIASANRDPKRWDDPHTFDVRRSPKPHLSFGSGAHLCIGMHLARMEMRTVMNAVLDRLSNLRFDPEQPKPFMTGLMFRMPTALPVLFDV